MYYINIMMLARRIPLGEQRQQIVHCKIFRNINSMCGIVSRILDKFKLTYRKLSERTQNKMLFSTP